MNLSVNYFRNKYFIWEYKKNLIDKPWFNKKKKNIRKYKLLTLKIYNLKVNQKSILNKLPYEILENIYKFLNLSDFFQLALVCKYQLIYTRNSGRWLTFIKLENKYILNIPELYSNRKKLYKTIPECKLFIKIIRNYYFSPFGFYWLSKYLLKDGDWDLGRILVLGQNEINISKKINYYFNNKSFKIYPNLLSDIQNIFGFKIKYHEQHYYGHYVINYFIFLPNKPMVVHITNYFYQDSFRKYNYTIIIHKRNNDFIIKLYKNTISEFSGTYLEFLNEIENIAMINKYSIMFIVKKLCVYKWNNLELYKRIIKSKSNPSEYRLLGLD